ncbi:MAG: ABC transporter ATP-binding protein [Chloroflexi bacterium]|jgi:putative ABC transport system ATP-binding protein|nr:ABC transporter ATP-binding protein [Anaerolineaceae bacterium]NMB86991.1 ABC transporter ATP-binding protein [Chloroflexota bacterium]
MSAASFSTAPSADAVIRTQELVKSYAMGDAQVRALRGVNLSIRAGEFVALMGPSGCGKSTLLQILGCLDTPSQGSYTLEGREVGGLSSDERTAIRRTRLGFVFQNFFLIPNLSSLENVTLPLLYQRKSGPALGKAAAVLEQMGLGDRLHHRPTQLSGGERQRVAIARALVVEPAILLADEPTGNLDTAMGQEILQLLNSLWHSGLTILLVTHDAQVASYAQRVLYMRDGNVIREESKHDLPEHSALGLAGHCGQ